MEVKWFNTYLKSRVLCNIENPWQIFQGQSSLKRQFGAYFWTELDTKSMMLTYRQHLKTHMPQLYISNGNRKFKDQQNTFWVLHGTKTMVQWIFLQF